MNFYENLASFSKTVYSLYKDLNPIEVITNYQLLSDGNIFYIDNGKENILFNDSYKTNITNIKALSNKTFKVEGFENYDKNISSLCNIEDDEKFIDCHFYWGKQGKTSFIEHTDPYDVVIVMLRGTKKIVFTDLKKEKNLNEGDVLFIPKNIAHYAENINENVSLSFGIRNFYEKTDLKLESI